MRLRGGSAVLAAALPALALQASSIASASSIRLHRLSTSSPYVGCKTRGPGHGYPNAGLHPQIAVDPRTGRKPRPTLLAVWAQDPWSNGGARGLMTALSVDGGQKWRERRVPMGTCARRRSTIARVSSPSLSIGPDGVVYLGLAGMSTASLSSTTSADTEAPFDTMLVATSHNDGANWTHIHALPFNAGYVSKVSMAADPRRRSTAYVVWDSDAGGWFSRTTNGGTSWSRPALILPGQPNLSEPAGESMIVDPRTGALDLIYDYIHPLRAPRRYCGHRAGRRSCYTFKPPAGLAPFGVDLMMEVSHNRGRTWARARFIAQDLGVGRVSPRDSGWTWMAWHRPAAAVNPRTGAVSVVWQDSRFSLGWYDEVALSISDRTGQHWSAPARVDSGKAAAVIPSVAVNARGVTGISYYQLRGVPAGSRVPAADYWFRAASGPAHLSHPQRLEGPLDLGRTGQVFAPFVDRAEGMAATGTTFRSVFVAPAKALQQTSVVTATIH